MGPQTVVGQSLGGFTGAALAAAHPELVVDITLGINVTAGPAALQELYTGPTDFATRDELVDRAIAPRFGGTRPETERGVFLNTSVRPDGRIKWKHHFAHLAAHALAAHDTGTAQRPSLLHETRWENLAAMVAPITLVCAGRGFVSDADAQEFLRRLPSARLEVIDASHNVHKTAPATLGALMTDAVPTTPKGNRSCSDASGA